MKEKTDFDFFVEVVRELNNNAAVDNRQLIHLLGRLGGTLANVRNMDELETLREDITQLRHEMVND